MASLGDNEQVTFYVHVIMTDDIKTSLAAGKGTLFQLPCLCKTLYNCYTYLIYFKYAQRSFNHLTAEINNNKEIYVISNQTPKQPCKISHDRTS